MTQKLPRKPWHEAVRLRDGPKTGELSLAVVDADLYNGLPRGVSP